MMIILLLIQVECKMYKKGISKCYIILQREHRPNYASSAASGRGVVLSPVR